MTFDPQRRTLLIHAGGLAALPVLSACGGAAQSDIACTQAPAASADPLGDAGLYLESASNLLRKAPANGPSVAMRQFLARSRYGMFLHFGMDTFTDQELGDGLTAASVYAPSGIDAAGWAKSAKEGGIDYVLLICKHHDGFCIWPASNNSYNVSQSGNRTDVVKAVAEACAAQGIRFGAYYSLWDRHWDHLNQCGENDNWKYSAQQNADYQSYMLGHLRELFSNYGPVITLWLDGSWAKSADEWGLARVYDLVKRLQPDCQIGVNGTLLDAGHAKMFPSDFRLQDPYFADFPDNKRVVYDNLSYYLPWQTTITLNAHWFWHASDTLVKSVDELEYDYYKATAQDNSYVLNSPPDSAGVMRADNAAQLALLRQRLGLRPGGVSSYPVNLSPAATGTATSILRAGISYGAQQALSDDPDVRWAADDGVASCVLTQTFAAPSRVDHVVLREYGGDTAGGANYAIRAYTVEAQVAGGWLLVAKGTTVGKSALLALNAITAAAIRISITAADRPPSLWAFWAFSYPMPGC